MQDAGGCLAAAPPFCNSAAKIGVAAPQDGDVVMGSMSVWHWLILLAVVLLFFGGKGKISSIMGDVADGIKSFKKGMQDDDAKKAEAAKSIEAQASKTVDNAAQTTKTS
jgi:sec-independent protein translocase protein TatA